MNSGLSSILVLLAGSLAPQASYQSPNFVVEAATPEVARRVADSAERYRKELALLWLGKKLPDWPFPCHIEVTLTLKRPQGFTSIDFDQGEVHFRKVEVQGSLERILKGPLPHELTHVIFQQFFATPPPRWADEGGAILSEDGVQGALQHQLLRKMIADQRHFPLRRLFEMRDYPRDVLCLYAQGHSVAHFLVAEKDHKTFLVFVRDGTANGWDEAVKTQYGYETVEQLEAAWMNWLRRSKNGQGVAASSGG